MSGRLFHRGLQTTNRGPADTPANSYIQKARGKQTYSLYENQTHTFYRINVVFVSHVTDLNHSSSAVTATILRVICYVNFHRVKTMCATRKPSGWRFESGWSRVRSLAVTFQRHIKHSWFQENSLAWCSALKVKYMYLSLPSYLYGDGPHRAWDVGMCFLFLNRLWIIRQELLLYDMIYTVQAFCPM